jgi:hypothetical protein
MNPISPASRHQLLCSLIVLEKVKRNIGRRVCWGAVGQVFNLPLEFLHLPPDAALAFAKIRPELRERSGLSALFGASSCGTRILSHVGR